MILPPWLWNIATHRRTKVALICLPFFLMILGVSFYAIMNWKGSRDAERHLNWLKAQGLAVAFEEYYPKPEDAERDLLQHPAVINELGRPDEEKLNRINRSNYGTRFQGFANQVKAPKRELAERVDVRQFFDPVRHASEAEAAREMLDELAPERARMQGIAEALARQDAFWNVNWELYDGILRPSFRDQFSFKGFSTFASAVCMMHLVADESEDAADLVIAMLDSRRQLCQQRSTLVSCLIGWLAFFECTNVIHEGIIRGKWNDDMLARFEKHLILLDPHQDFIQSLEGEICYHSLSIQKARKGALTQDIDLLDGWELDREMIFWRIRGLWWSVRPIGMSLSEFVESSNGLVNEGLNTKGNPRQRFERWEEQDFRMRHDALPHANFGGGSDVALDGSYLQVLRMAAEKSLQKETMVALLRTGIALERHRLRHGENPESLNDLTPEFLPAFPNDPYDGTPLKYHRQSDGSPVVWSIGPDLIDDGGKPNIRAYSGDVVWITRPIEGFSEQDLYKR